MKICVGLSDIIEQKMQEYFTHLDGMAPSKELYTEVLREVERPLLKIVLAKVKGNKVRAAEILGINRNTLTKKMREHDLKTE